LTALLTSWLLAAVAVGPGSEGPRRPSPSALRRAAEAGGRASVRVRATGSGPGVLVGAHGEVLTLGTLLRGESALVQLGGAQHPAKLVQRLPAFGLVLLAVDGEGPFPAPGARLEPPVLGEWVVGVAAAGSAPALGRITRATDGSFDTSLRLAPGSPVLDGQGQLLGIVTARRRDGTRAVALPAVRAQLVAGPGR
jgi:S1-C subfamily serine protease